jgi:hypothetical protein
MKLPVNYELLSIADRKRVRNEYVVLQGGLCYHCSQPLDGNPSSEVMALPVNTRLFPQTFFKWPVHLHHSHDTGMTIGAVHCYCNAVLWQYYNE